MTRVPLRRPPVLLLALLAGAGAAPTAAAQQVPAPQPQPRRQTAARPAQPASRPFTLAVRREDGFITVALAARQARVADIARELAAQLRLRIDVGPSIAQEAVTLDLPSGPLEATLQALAPRVLVDYERRRDAEPQPLAVRLLGATDPAPRANVRDREGGASQGIVLSGHTEETPTEDGSEPVAVALNADRLSLTTKDQPLALVAMVLAETLGVPLDIGYPAGELVTATFTDLPVEDAVLSLSPNLRLHVRVDLSAAERTPLELRLVPPLAVP